MTEPDLSIKASPTKEFFIFMLTKDIDLTRAILDLVDNCVDGARKLRGKKRLDDLAIRLEVSNKEFKITDNCGGIDVEIARNYAFRFGRPPDAPKVQHSIGQFGVGMKRALFKIGDAFHIESRTQNAFFEVDVNVKTWAADRENWNFKFKTLKENLTLKKGEEYGTSIRVTKLREGIAQEFGLSNFITKLRSELASAHELSLDNGIAIWLNGEPIEFSPPSMLSGNGFEPAFEELEFEGGKVLVKMHAGVAESNPKEAGWNVYCNGRLILEGDKSRFTGWGDGVGNYHNEYARFRGFVFFDSDQPELLPWNTTKSAVDTDSVIYRAVRLEMIEMMKPVISFLSRIAKQKKRKEEDEPTQLELQLKKASSKSIKTLPSKKASFKVPPDEVKEADLVTIEYERPKALVQKAKAALKAKTYRDVGERTFDYFVEMECD